MKKLLCMLLMMILIISSLSSCSGDKAEKDGFILDGSKEIYPEDFLEISGEKVSFQEFRYYYLNYRDMYIEKNGAEYFDSEDAEKALKDEIVKCLKDSIAVKKLAEKNGISLTPEEEAEVQNDIKSTTDYYGGKDELAKVLKESYMTRSLYESMAKFSSLYMKVFEALFADDSENAWDDARFFEYYKENYMAVQEIFIKYKNSETKDDNPATMLAAEDIFKKASSGEDFWKLIEEYGEDENMEQNPDGYYFKEGEAEDILYDAAKLLSENEISAPVKGASGIYIIKRVPLKEEIMLKNKDIALKGYEDSDGTHHPGKYDELFEEIYSNESDSLEVKYPEIWDKISTETVF